MIKVFLDRKARLIDRSGEMILELKYDGITKIDNDRFILKKGDKVGILHIK